MAIAAFHGHAHVGFRGVHVPFTQQFEAEGLAEAVDRGDEQAGGGICASFVLLCVVYKPSAGNPCGNVSQSYIPLTTSVYHLIFTLVAE